MTIASVVSAEGGVRRVQFGASPKIDCRCISVGY